MANFPIQRTTATLPGYGPNAYLSMSTRTGAGMQARALGELGAAATDVGLVLNRLQAQQEFVEAQMADQLAMQELAVEFEKNSDPHTYDESFNRTMDVIQQREIKNGLARQQHDLWVKRMTPAWNQGLIEAKENRIKSNFMATLFQAEQGAIQNGSIAPYIQMLHQAVQAGLFDEQEKVKLEARIGGIQRAWVDRQAIDLIRSAGPQTAIDFVLAQSEILNVEEQSKLIKRIENTADNMQAEFDRIADEKQTAAIGELFSKVSNVRPQLSSDDLDKAQKNLISVAERQAWETIYAGIGKVNANTKTDYRRALALDDKILDYWGGLAKSAGDKTSILTELAKARYADRYIDDAYWGRINKWLQLDVPTYDVEKLRAAFKELEAKGTAVGVGPWNFWITEKGAEKIAKARDDYLQSYYSERVMRKKDMTEEDFIIKARKMAAMFLAPDVTERTERPENIEQFYENVARLKATDMDAARAYYDRWVSEWQ